MTLSLSRQFLRATFLILTAGCAGSGQASIASQADAGPHIYYVAPISTSCSPKKTGSGTMSEPWTNLYYALTQGGLRPGDTLQLRGGTYRNEYYGFMSDHTESNRRRACDDDRDADGGYDGTHTVLPLFLAGTVGNEIVIENYPGETVVIDGTNARISGVEWKACGDGTYFTADFNVGNARTSQVWVKPAGPADPGMRLQWKADVTGQCSLQPGQFSVIKNGRELYVHLQGGVDPSGQDLRMSCQNGDCAAHPVVADGSAQFVIVRRNERGGGFYVKYGYYGARVDRGARHLTFDGIHWIAHGGRDYGHCFRVVDGHFITVRNGTCRESMAEGIAFYGGGPHTGVNITNNFVEKMEIYDTGRAWVDGGGKGNSLGMGVILKNCSNCAVRDSRIRNSYRGGIQVNHSSHGCPDTACRAENALIERNVIWDFCRVRSGSDINAGRTDCGAVLLRHDGTNGTVNGGIIRNNIVLGMFDVPFSNDAAPAGIYTDGAIADVHIVNNSLNNIPGACINVEPNPYQVSIIGNAMDNCSSSGGGCNGQECALFTHASTAHDSQYNTYWAGSDASQVIWRRSSTGISRANVSEMWEPTAVQASPGFLSTSDLRLAPDSKLIDAQPCNLAPQVDVHNSPRPVGPACDIGAIEWKPPLR